MSSDMKQNIFVLPFTVSFLKKIKHVRFQKSNSNFYSNIFSLIQLVTNYAMFSLLVNTFCFMLDKIVLLEYTMLW